MKTRNLFHIVTAFLLVATFHSEALAGFASLRANASYSSSESTSTRAGVKTTSEFESETYTLYLSKKLTRVLSLSASSSHSIRESNGVRDTNTSPVVSLNFSPPSFYVFNFSMNRTQTYPTDQVGLITTGADLRFYIPTGKKLPSLNMTYNRSASEDDQETHLVDSHSDIFRLSSSYNVKVLGENLGISYGFGYLKSQNNISKLANYNVNNTIGLSWGKRYFKNKFRTNYSLSTSRNTNTYESLSNPRRFETVIPSDFGLAQIDALPEASALPVDAEMVDNSYNAIAAMSTLGLTDFALGSDWNFGVDLGVSQPIFGLNLYILVPSTSATLFESEANILMGNLGWKVYTSSNNAIWGPVGGISVLPLVEQAGTNGSNTIYKLRFIFTELNARFVKLYNPGISGALGNYPILVSEIEALAYINQQLSFKESRSSSGESFSFSSHYSHSKELSMGYSLSLSQTSADAYKGSRATSHSLFARWTPNTKARGSLSHSRSDTKNLDRNNTFQSNTTSISMSYRPLKALNGSLRTSFSDSSVDGKKINSSNTLTTSVIANIYKGFAVSTSFRSSNGKQLVAKSSTNSSGVSWNVRLSPWRPVQLSYQASSFDSSIKSPIYNAKSSSKSSSASVSIRLTNNIFLSGGFNIEPTTSSSYSLSWRPLPILSFSGSFSDNDFQSSTSFTSSWRVLRKLSFSFSQSISESKNVTKDRNESSTFGANYRF